MKVAKTRRFKAKDGTFLLTAILESSPNLEDLTDVTQVAVFARRDLIFLQRLFSNLKRKQRLTEDEQAFKLKVTKLLDILTKASSPEGNQCPRSTRS